MGDPGLTESNKERFEELREKLEGVDTADQASRERPVEIGPIDPMLAETYEGAITELDEESWIAEQKYDGTRIIFEKIEGEIRAFTRRGVERSDRMPDIVQEAEANVPSGTILDAEYALVRPDGGTYFVPIHGGDDKIAEKNLTPELFVFDILVADTEWVTEKSLTERKVILRDTINETPHITVVPFVESGFQNYYDSLIEKGEEGIILKRCNSHYYTGTRSTHWRKVKAFAERDAVVVGYTPGEGARSDTFGALVLTDGTDYIGRVGSGFSEDQLVSLIESFTEADEKPVSESDVGKPYTPIEPFVIQVKYQEITDNNELRAPVFLKRRPEKPLNDITPIDRPDS